MYSVWYAATPWQAAGYSWGTGPKPRGSLEEDRGHTKQNLVTCLCAVCGSSHKGSSLCLRATLVYIAAACRQSLLDMVISTDLPTTNAQISSCIIDIAVQSCLESPTCMSNACKWTPGLTSAFFTEAEQTGIAIAFVLLFRSEWLAEDTSANKRDLAQRH